MKTHFTSKMAFTIALIISTFTTMAFGGVNPKNKTPEVESKKLAFCFSKFHPGPVLNFIDENKIKLIYDGTKADLKVLNKKTRTNGAINVLEYTVLDEAEGLEWIVKISSFKKDKQLYIIIGGEQQFFGSLSGCSSLIP